MNPRVLLVIAQLAVGGAEVQFVRLARGLRDHGFEPEVGVFYPGGALEPRLRERDIRVHHIRRHSKVGLESIRHLRAVLRAGGHQVVHSYLWPANWRTRVAAIAASTPVIIASPRSVETFLTPLHVWVDRWLARRTDSIAVNATAIRDYLVERERLPLELFRVIPNGIDLLRFENLPDRATARSRLGLDPDQPVVLSLGNLEPEKNHEDFVRMAGKVLKRHPQTRFVVVGRGNDERRAVLERLSRQLGVEHQLCWVGFQQEITTYLAACDVSINTSRREGCCNALLESMAASRPVVAYPVGGNPELIDPGVNGQLVEFGDTDALAGVVCDYLANPDDARRHGHAGALRVAAGYSIDTMVRRTAELYTELLKRKLNHDGQEQTTG